MEAFGREDAHDELAGVKIVFDDEDVAGGGHVVEVRLSSPVPSSATTNPAQRALRAAARIGISRIRV